MVLAALTAGRIAVLVAILAVIAVGWLLRSRKRSGPGPLYYLREDYIEDQFKPPEDERDLL